MNARDRFLLSFLLVGTFCFTAMVHAWADDVKPAGSAPTAPLPRPPIHRYSFGGQGGGGAVLTDSIGGAHGQVYVEPPQKPLPYHDGSATVVVIPDTEVYANKQPHIFNAMMQWIADNRDERNIGYVLHVGDITNNNAEHEWKNARKAFDIIEGKIPYVLAAGNHDYDHTPGRLSYMNDYFKVEDQKKWPNFGNVYESGKLENHYQFMEINGQKWVVLSLEMGPRREVLVWANKVLDEYEDRLAIILTHGYLYYGNERYDHTKGGQRASPYDYYGDGADGEMMWNQLVRKHANMMMVICGHLSSQYVGYRKDKADHGNIVHQMLVDYEKMRGGQGFLRLLEFLPDGQSVQVRTYSPVTKQIRSPITRRDKPLQDPKLEEFTFELQTAPGEESRLATRASAKSLEKAPGDAENDVENSEEHIRLNGQGQLVIDANDGKGYGKLDADLLKGREEVSFEVWFTPTANGYGWDPVVHFGGDGDAFYYTFRTLNTHRAELIVNGHNQDIQRSINVKVGQPMHVVVTYDQDGEDGRPLLSSYVDGKLTGRMVTNIKLSELELTSGQIGPFAGEFDELRVYDHALTANEVAGSFSSGPDKLELAEGVPQPEPAAAAAPAEEAARVKAELNPLLTELRTNLTSLIDKCRKTGGEGYEKGQVRFALGHLDTAKSLAPLAPEGITAETVKALSGTRIHLELATEALDAEPPPRALDCGTPGRAGDSRSPAQGIAYDTKTGLYVIFAGDHLDYLTNDTWVFDPAANRWITLDIKYDVGERYGTTTRAFPHTRSDGIVFDPQRKLIWGTDTNSQVFVLRIDPKRANARPL